MNSQIKNNFIMVNFLERDKEAFWRDGFFILRDLVQEKQCIELREIAEQHLANQLAPIEYEVDVQYPGSPMNRDSEGGKTPRRLLQAFSRHKSSGAGLNPRRFFRFLRSYLVQEIYLFPSVITTVL